MPAVKALVQVDLGPSVVLGSSLMISAIALYQVRAARPEVSRDKDVFFSSIGLLCGGILIFQGWRLDPLMLFGQLLTTATAVAFATETISLRQELLDVEDAGDSGTRGRPGRGQRGRRSGRVRSLPPVNDRNVESREITARAEGIRARMTRNQKTRFTPRRRRATETVAPRGLQPARAAATTAISTTSTPT